MRMEYFRTEQRSEKSASVLNSGCRKWVQRGCVIYPMPHSHLKTYLPLQHLPLHTHGSQVTWKYKLLGTQREQWKGTHSTRVSATGTLEHFDFWRLCLHSPTHVPGPPWSLPEQEPHRKPQLGAWARPGVSQPSRAEAQALGFLGRCQVPLLQLVCRRGRPLQGAHERLLCPTASLVLVASDLLCAGTEVGPQELRGVGSKTPMDTKVHRYSSSYYKMMSFSHIGLLQKVHGKWH